MEVKKEVCVVCDYDSIGQPLPYQTQSSSKKNPLLEEVPLVSNVGHALLPHHSMQFRRIVHLISHAAEQAVAVRLLHVFVEGHHVGSSSARCRSRRRRRAAAAVVVLNSQLAVSTCHRTAPTLVDVTCATAAPGGHVRVRVQAIAAVANASPRNRRM